MSNLQVAQTPKLTGRTRWSFIGLALVILALFGYGLSYVGMRTVDTMSLSLAFFGGMTMLLTP